MFKALLTAMRNLDCATYNLTYGGDARFEENLTAYSKAADRACDVARATIATHIGSCNAEGYCQDCSDLRYYLNVARIAAENAQDESSAFMAETEPESSLS